MRGDRAPATGAGRLHTPTGPVGAGPRGAAAARAAPAAGYGDAGGSSPRTAAGAQARPTTGQHTRKRACRAWAVAYGRSTDAAATQPQPPPQPQSALNRARAGPSRHAASPPAATAGRPAHRRPHMGRPQVEPAEPAGRVASRAASPRRVGGQPHWGAGQPPWAGHLGQGGSAHWGGWPARFRAGPALGPARLAGWASPIGGVAQPDLAGGPARLGGWASPIWGGGWPGGRRASHPPDRAQTTTYGAPVPRIPIYLSHLARSRRDGRRRLEVHVPLQERLREVGLQ